MCSVARLMYRSGEEVRRGDCVKFHGNPGKVQFIVTELTGGPSMDWYLDEFPGGGFMIAAEGFGNVFVGPEDIDDDLEFVLRAE